ncbi:ASCH domain-containing protein [Streptomyces sp. NPDC002784]
MGQLRTRYFGRPPLHLYRQYFGLVTAGTKTIEVRVKYPHLAVLVAGDTIRFRIKGTDETCEVKVVRVTEYADFETLLDGKGAGNVNPTATRDGQLANIRAIYPPEKEALGALAIKLALRSSQLGGRRLGRHEG